MVSPTPSRVSGRRVAGKNFLDDLSNSGPPFDYVVKAEQTARQKERKAMTRNQIHSIFLSAFVLVCALIAAASLPAAAQDSNQPYPTMAPVEQYLMDRDAEIALARSAAPDAISHDASVIVLTRHGY